MISLLFFFLLLHVDQSVNSCDFNIEFKESVFLDCQHVCLSDEITMTEDSDDYIYLADAKLNKFFTFYSNGQLIGEFGKKGNGPGDLSNPSDIALSEDNHVVICDSYSVSFFKKNGEYVKKYMMSKAGRPLIYKKYAGKNSILARKILDRNSTPPLFLVKLEPEISVISEAIQTCSPQMLFNECGVSDTSITPDIFYSYCNGLSVVASSEDYMFKIIDPEKNGVPTKTISRKIKNIRLTQAEKDYLIDDLINSWDEIDQATKNGLKKTIPDVKNIISGIFLTKKNIFVMRVKTNLSDIHSKVPMDVFSINGDFLGQVSFPSEPLYIGDKYVFFKKDTPEGDFEIFKVKYALSK